MREVEQPLHINTSCGQNLRDSILCRSFIAKSNVTQLIVELGMELAGVKINDA